MDFLIVLAGWFLLSVPAAMLFGAIAYWATGNMHAQSTPAGGGKHRQAAMDSA